MKRFVVSTLGLLLIAAVVGVTGCDGGSTEPAPPKTATPGLPPEKLKEIADMSKGPKAPTTPPGAAAPAPAPSAPTETPKK